MSPRRLTRALAALFRPRRADAEVADEVAHYLEEATAAHLARGMTPEAARRAALLEVGRPAAVREEVRTSGWEHAIEITLRDVRYGLRRLIRSPVFTLTAVATLAIGVGASTAVFSVVHPILLEPLPFPEADRLVTLDDWNSQGFPMPATLGTYDEVRSRSRSFEALAAADQWRPSLTGKGTPERVEGQRVSPAYFGVFGAIPRWGRGFIEADDQRGGPRVVILSYRLAQRRFGTAREIVGREIDLNGDPHLVIGVMPPDFDNVIAPAVEIWAPLRERSSGDLTGREWGHHYDLVGRLAGTVTVESASREILAIGGSPAAEFPRPSWASLGQGLLIRPLQESITRSARPALYAIVAAVSLLLVIASVNVANLLLARGAQRREEFAMRMALGANRGRLLRQLLTESVVLALVGGALGLLVAQIGIRALLAASPPGLPRIGAIRLSLAAFGFAAGLTTVIGLMVGLAPGLGASRLAAREGLHGGIRSTGGGRRNRTRSALVVAEVGLALTLLVSAGLLLRSVGRLTSVAPGFDPTRVLTMQVVEAGHEFNSDAARLLFYEQALEAVRGVPGVVEAGFTSQLPLSGEVDGYGWEAAAHPETRPGEAGAALRYAVSPGYFAAMRIPLVAGRLLEESDRWDSPLAVVINQSFAEQLVGKQSVLGQRLRFGAQMGSGQWMEVVGVVGDVRHYSLAVDPPAAFYTATAQWDWVDNVATLVIRSSRSPVALVPAVKAALWSVNPSVPIQRVQTMDGFIAASAGNRRFTLLAIAVLAITALLLSAVGLYGVISGSVTERVREIGVRTALGATPLNVVGQVMRQALTLTGLGVVIGVAGGYGASRVIATMLFGVTALDPVTYLGVIGVMVGIALLASWAPARRAVGIDPLTALRSE